MPNSDNYKQTIKSKILEHMKLLEFELVNSENINYWTKSYGKDTINVNLENGWIDFPEKLKIHHHSASKLVKDENFVVLECVDRLLRKGYPAERIELEKTWKVGKNEGGRLDVLVRCLDSEEIYLMIECKTEDSDEDALIQMKYDGGQLFSYLQQDNSAKYLCLYVSWIYSFRMRHRYFIVPVNQSIRDCKNVDEMYNKWNKKYVTGGDVFGDAIFGETVSPFGINLNFK